MRIGLTAKNWRPSRTAGSVLGFLDIVVPLPGGGQLILKGCRYMHSQRKGTRWVNLPEEKYRDRDTGEDKWRRLVWIEDKARARAFEDEASAAAEALYQGAGGDQAQQPQQGGGWGGRW